MMRKGATRMANKSGGKVLRFGKAAIFAHWAMAINFFILALTGLLIYADFFDFLAPLFGGIQGARLIHRVSAVGFIVLPLLGLFANFKGFLEWMSYLVKWGKDDWGFLKAFPKEFFGGHVEVPPQDKFNAGEKINSIVQLVGCVTLAITGLILWFPESFSQGVLQIALPLHTGAFVLTFTAFIGHCFLATIHPATKGALPGIINGYVDEEFAKSHYPKWYAKISKNNQGSKG